MTRKINYWQLVILSFFCMFIFGFVENLRGVAVPPIREEFDVSYGSIGIMLLISSLGYLSATFLGGMIADRIGTKNVMTLGFLLLIIGCAVFPLSPSFLVSVIIIFVINMGFGCFEVATNSLGAQIFVRNTALMMNMMHLFYGLASAVAPKYGSWILLQDLSWKYIYFYALIPVVIIMVYMMFNRFPEESQDSEQSRKVPMKEIATNKKVWYFVAICGLGQVAELGAGNWTVNFLQESRGMDVDLSALYMMWFFVAFTVGRLIGGFISEWIGYANSIAWFTLSYVVFLVAGMVLGNDYAFFFALTGFSTSIMFPTVMSMVMREFTVGRASIMGFIITASGGVNMLANWLIGKTNDFFGVDVGYASIAFYTALILVFIALVKPLLTAEKKVAQT